MTPRTVFDRDKLFNLYGKYKKLRRFKMRRGMTREQFNEWKLETRKYIDGFEAEKAPLWESHIKENMERWPYKGVDEMYNARDGGSALLVGAGRSAGNALPKGVYIACADRALPSLKARGITPDLVVSIDPNERCASWLWEYNGDIVLSVLSHPNTPAVLGLTANVYRCAGCFPGSAFWKRTYEIYGRNIANTLGGPTITHTIVSILVFMGFSRIVTIGNELCFHTSAEHATDYNREHELILRQGHLTIPVFALTAKALYDFPMLFPDVEFIDVSGGLEKPGWTMVNRVEEKA